MKFVNPTDENQRLFREFLESRPPHVRAVAERFDPWTLYKLKGTGQRCSVIGFHEVDVEKERERKAKDPHGCGVALVPVTVFITAENPVLGQLTAHSVFGIDPDELVPWTAEDDAAAGPSMAASVFGTERYP